MTAAYVAAEGAEPAEGLTGCSVAMRDTAPFFGRIRGKD
jgi:hypothetical protein